ncbi:MAG TPA: ABC transporter ATP-binding protein [Pirellulaceae bacterium]|jgi:ABC-2 type transport system ATP-binding protein|nr:ABC transporter ATP-binding protein [Pirellulaceae bacterium]
MIEFVDVVRSYGNKIAVNGLDLAIPKGQLFSFLGPNGAGKTTTIKMLIGLLRPDRGTVRVDGLEVEKHPRETALRIGYVPDEPYVYEKLTGREFLTFLGEMYGLEKLDVRERIDLQIRRFELSGFVDQMTESYSHGMKQRLVFAAALLHDPKVLVVDEPMVGLDPRSIRKVKDLLRQQADEGVTVFMSTHTLSIAEEISDRIGMIRKGRIVFLGTMEELRTAQAQLGGNLEEIFLQLTAEEGEAPFDTEAEPGRNGAPTSAGGEPDARAASLEEEPR